SNKRESKRRATPREEPIRTREPQFQLPITRREVASSSPIRKPAVSKPAVEPAELNLTQSALDVRLRAWRKEQAHAMGLPSFFVFSDSVLRDIVLAAPASLADLRGICGLGPDKLDRFGSAVLEVCRE
ncbi:MAG TPA: HRDC domain-containing protein, partial [Terracidiphilus sp.]